MPKIENFIFPKWSNYVLPTVLISITIILSILIGVIWYWMSPKHTDVGYMPEQPIPYSHKLHAGELGIDCRYCHVNVEKSPKATIPPTEICMNCHKTIKKDSPHIEKIRSSFANNTPIEWVRVHKLPDYAYFDHSRHVNSGVSCVECHGRVDKMEVVRQVEPLSMSWCLDCHRSPAKHIRPKDKVTDLTWTTKNKEQLGMELIKKYHIKTSEDCSTCHR
ncbi:MAG: cytochrome c3 family protein [Candidatus Margulisbacteria bacterium]|nr:cytochrome c3 family protein [Candidatus Margulisiibacteriota bacterium]